MALKKTKKLETNGNENTTSKSYYTHTHTQILRGMFITIQSYPRKQEISQLHNLNLYLKQLEKEKETMPKVNRRNELMITRPEINEIEILKKGRSMKPKAKF